MRRGELEGVHAKYAGITDLAEFKRLCEALDSNEIKKREIEELYKRGKIATNASAARRHTCRRRSLRRTQLAARRLSHLERRRRRLQSSLLSPYHPSPVDTAELTTFWPSTRLPRSSLP